MLSTVVDIITKAQSYTRDGTLFCTGVLIDDQVRQCVDFLEEKQIIENSGFENKVEEIIDLELSVARLNGIGFYQSLESLLLKNRYDYPSRPFYVHEIKKFSYDETADVYFNHRGVIDFIDSIKTIAKHSYTDVDIDFALVFRDDKSLLLPFIYASKDIKSLSSEALKDILVVTEVFKEANTEKKLLFINELIDFLSPVAEPVKLATLLRNISYFTDNCNNAYQYYLRDFSYNKLKIELDSKALEFAQKIQGVINDSQTKLVTIPTAFVLVFATFDFNDINSVKNIASIISLFIFAVLLQLFLNNQYSSLNFTESNVQAYKATFSQSNIEKFKEKFELVDTELSKQKNRLRLVTIMLWLIPIGLLIIWSVLLWFEI